MLANSLKSIENAYGNCLKVYTLGCFEVKSGKKVISNDCKRSQQLWNLFKYILTYRNKRIAQENFIDILWVDKECDNPIKALQNLIYRLRMLLNYEGVNKEGDSIINYSQGCYSWNKEFNYWTDVDEFEELYKKSKVAENNEDFLYAIELYQTALLLYKGDYLSEESYNEWVTPVRNYYNRIYMDIIGRLTNLLKHYGRNEDILKVCEEALMIHPFEERLHVLYIEALIAVGNIKQAQSQYEYVTSMLYKEMGVKPSTELRNLYHQIKCTDDNILLDLNSIQEMMMDRSDPDGAFFCEPDIFTAFYKLEGRRAARTKQVVFMAMLTISRVRNRNQDSEILKKATGALLDMLVQGLRMGDVVAKISETQILAILPGPTFEQANMVIARILNKHKIVYTSKDIIIKTSLQPINEIEA
ncbi:bacterial transcriptional activator domain-containing protein [Clostridium bowmanii]|uniref:bacterial transcriptional activator domain-containing protein n=1 Tax=Clostridium bowmanii TaxID=132925 RepID=UPI001C0BF03E|nr:bacterial transcriptional activator domain-containing protein [Clostridium bowmanii]MBU3191198.1 bacterial transcriptional activator domain-containing protein [Clostridium bowmanii]MCA1075646.1 bacterial transcriptional activator domain-containing protein [Clostridium bowmanii]